MPSGSNGAKEEKSNRLGCASPEKAGSSNFQSPSDGETVLPRQSPDIVAIAETAQPWKVELLGVVASGLEFQIPFAHGSVGGGTEAKAENRQCCSPRPAGQLREWVGDNG
uniref:Uncharacterized protein n=1 Tax=Bursaphelenchus xylophilus TaxID=6326 RepID=A0A1I7RWE4_BURXY